MIDKFWVRCIVILGPAYMIAAAMLLWAARP